MRRVGDRGGPRRRALRGASAGVVGLLLGGCWWPVPGQGGNRQAHNPAEEAIGVETVGRLRQAWEATVNDGPVGDPVTSTAGVHVADRTRVYAFHTDSGTRRWVSGVDAPLVVGQPFVRGEQVLVGQWNPTATRETDPSASDVTVVLDAATGAPAGEVAPGVMVGLRGDQALLTDDEWIRFGARVQVEVWDQDVAVHDLDRGSPVCCSPYFAFRSGGPTATAPPPPSTLSFTSEWLLHTGQGVVDLADPTHPDSRGNGVRAYTWERPPTCGIFGWDHCPAWVVPLDGATATPAVLSDDHSVAYVGTDAGTVHAVDVAAAEVIWSVSVGAPVTDSPALAEGSLFVPTEAGEVVAVVAADGRIAWWSQAAGGAITQQPAVANGVVFAGSADGAVHAFDTGGCAATTCPPLWTGDARREVTGAPAVSNGRLYVGTADGRLVAFALAED